MRRRKRLSRTKSRRMFSKTSLYEHPRNSKTNYRGGIRDPLY